MFRIRLRKEKKPDNAFSIDVPDPLPVKHRKDFTTDEVKSALFLYLEQQGVTIPKGEVRLHFKDRFDPEEEPPVTLVILEKVDYVQEDCVG